MLKTRSKRKLSPPSRSTNKHRSSSPKSSQTVQLSSITHTNVASSSPIPHIATPSRTMTTNSPRQQSSSPSMAARRSFNRSSTPSQPSIPITTSSMALSSSTRSMSDTCDFAVIGGGSGGMAAAKEAARHGAKVVLFDFVKPSPQGTKWGLGGTCVNVGCVPKKLMHYAGNIGHTVEHDAQHYGWDVTKPKHNWEQLVETVQNHVHKLNFSYRGGLRSNKVNYINAHASFKDANTLEYTFRGETKTLTADKILIATGGRPIIPSDVPGAVEHAITSDDIFSLDRSPGKTLVVGASYIALECAGFLTALGYDTTVAVRSILLRGFDRQSADKIGEVMRCTGTKFVNHIPSEMTKDDSTGKIKVTFTNGDVVEYDTVMYATGRYADTKGLHLDKAGVTSGADGKFDVDDNEATNVSHIYAIGDILRGKPELTPVAIKTGELLAQRLFANSNKRMDWELVPTTVFTPAEYGSVGLSEEAAIAKYGEDNLEVYLYEWTTLEHTASHREKVESERMDEFDVDMPPTCFSKVICLRHENEKVVGIHYVGPNAGEVTQGFAVALRLGATKQDLDDTVGIHPTDAESLVSGTMTVTRRSGESWVAAGGCGGGKCG